MQMFHTSFVPQNMFLNFGGVSVYLCRSAQRVVLKVFNPLVIKSDKLNKFIEMKHTATHKANCFGSPHFF